MTLISLSLSIVECSRAEKRQRGNSSSEKSIVIGPLFRGIRRKEVDQYRRTDWRTGANAIKP